MVKNDSGKRARSSASPDAAPGTSPPIATRGSLCMADMSSHAEFRGQVVSLSSQSCYSIFAMLAPSTGDKPIFDLFFAPSTSRN